VDEQRAQVWMKKERISHCERICSVDNLQRKSKETKNQEEVYELKMFELVVGGVKRAGD
jgi:hypothetical protein